MGLFVHRIVLLCAESPLFLWFQRVFPQTERQVFHNIWKFDEKSANELLYISEKGMV